MANNYASIWKRGGALLIDTAIILIISYLIFLLNLSESQIVTIISSILIFSVYPLYFILLEKSGQTLGKKFLKIKIIQENGQKPGLLRAVTRNLFRLIDMLPLFYITGLIL